MDDKGVAVDFHVFTLMGLIALAFVVVLAVTLPSETVAQDVSTMNFTVTNSAPSVGTVTCAQNTPNEATDYTAWCFAVITDTNGYQDVSGCNGTFFRTSTGQTGTPDTNKRYFNDSCTLFGGTGNTVNCNCSFFMKYYADGNVEWTGNLTAKDPSTSARAAGTINLASLNSLELTANKVQWGSLVVGSQTTFNVNNRTVSNNTGNVNCSIQVKADTASMSCVPSPADITVDNIKSWISTGAYGAGGSALTTSQAETNPVAWIDNRQHTPDGRENRSIHWALSVPTGVNGTCTVTVNQYAIMVSSPAQ